MWVLFLILVFPTGMETGYMIAAYDSHYECHAEEVRLDAEMRQAYWHEKTPKIYLRCLTKAKGVS
jgi:hypothetical protein